MTRVLVVVVKAGVPPAGITPAGAGLMVESGAGCDNGVYPLVVVMAGPVPAAGGLPAACHFAHAALARAASGANQANISRTVTSKIIISATISQAAMAMIAPQ